MKQIKIENRNEYKKLHEQVYPATAERFNKIKKQLRKNQKKLTWKQVFSLIKIEYSELKKEADEVGVFIGVVVNREIQEVLDRAEKW